MSDDANAPVGGEAVAITLPADAPAAMNVSEAARLLSQARRSRQEAPPAESAPVATAEEPELAPVADAAPQTEVPSESETQDAEPAEMPPIEPPRSWTKEEKEAFLSWPREAQESISRVASTRETEFRRSQNEVADTKKAFEARLVEADQIRKQYEEKLPALSKALEASLQNEFADIQTFQDVRKMQAEDPFRYQQWDLRQKELAVVKQEEQAAEQRRLQEKQSDWIKFVETESKAFADDVPEFKAKEGEFTKKAAEALSALKFSNEEIAKLARGDDKVALYDRRFQRLLFDHIKLTEILAAPPKAIPKPVPPVTRPGTAKGGNPSVALQIQNLEQQLTKASGSQAIKIAAQLTGLKRSAAR